MLGKQAEGSGREKTEQLIRKASDVVGVELDSLTVASESLAPGFLSCWNILLHPRHNTGVHKIRCIVERR